LDATNPPSKNAPGAGAVLRVWGRRSVGVFGIYVVILLILLYFTVSADALTTSPYPTLALVAITGFYLARYFSTCYELGPTALRARRLVGSRTIPYDDIRRIEYASLRELGPVGMFGSWGYRGRMWSPTIGPFDAVYTESGGLLVTAGPVPLFLSPKNPPGFARELSRRVRSYHHALEVDVGASVPSGT
jgi:hypothetical protein